MEILKKIFAFLFQSGKGFSSLIDVNIGDKEESDNSKMLTDIHVNNNKGDVNISGRDIHHGK